MDAASGVSLVVAIAAVGWSWIRVRATRREARQASEVAATSIMVAAAAATDAARSRAALDALADRALAAEGEVSRINRLHLDETGTVTTLGATTANTLVRLRQDIDEARGGLDG